MGGGNNHAGRMVDLIIKKRSGEPLSRAELEGIIPAYCRSEIPDYQMSALLMAVFFRGMSEAETVDLTRAMLESGVTPEPEPADHCKSCSLRRYCLPQHARRRGSGSGYLDKQIGLALKEAP